MKKILSLALAVICMASMTIPTFAVDMNEGKDLWDAFVAEAQSAEADPMFGSIVNAAQLGAKNYSKYFVQTTGREAEEYESLTALEQYLWNVTYIQPALTLTYGDYDRYLSSETAFLSHGVMGAMGFLRNTKNEALIGAYEELMKWDYAYFAENNAFYCFLTEESSDEMTHLVTVPDNKGDELTDEDIEQITEALKDEMTKDELKELEKELQKEQERQHQQQAQTPPAPAESEKGGIGGILFTVVAALAGAGLGVGLFVWKKRRDDQ